MKPFIQIINIDEEVHLMYDASGDNCDALIKGETFAQFEVDITDARGESRAFNFTDGAIAEIFAKCLGEKSVDLINKILHSDELYVAIEQQEIFFGYEGFTSDTIDDFLAGEYSPEGGFIFRMTEKEEGIWVLSFVFENDYEISSKPEKWDDFQYEEE